MGVLSFSAKAGSNGGQVRSEDEIVGKDGGYLGGCWWMLLLFFFSFSCGEKLAVQSLSEYK